MNRSTESNQFASNNQSYFDIALHLSNPDSTGVYTAVTDVPLYNVYSALALSCTYPSFFEQSVAKQISFNYIPDATGIPISVNIPIYRDWTPETVATAIESRLHTAGVSAFQCVWSSALSSWLFSSGSHTASFTIESANNASSASLLGIPAGSSYLSSNAGTWDYLLGNASGLSWHIVATGVSYLRPLRHLYLRFLDTVGIYQPSLRLNDVLLSIPYCAQPSASFVDLPSELLSKFSARMGWRNLTDLRFQWVDQDGNVVTMGNQPWSLHLRLIVRAEDNYLA